MIEYFRKHPRLGEMVRFLIVGTLSTIIDFLCMSLFIYFFNIETYSHRLFNVFFGAGSPSSWSVTVGTGVGFLISLVFSYTCSTLFVFRSSNDFAKSYKGVLLYFALSTIALGIQVGLMYLGYALLGLNEWLLKVVITLITMTFNFVTRKKLVYSDTLSANCQNEKIDSSALNSSEPTN